MIGADIMQVRPPTRSAAASSQFNERASERARKGGDAQKRRVRPCGAGRRMSARTLTGEEGGGVCAGARGARARPADTGAREREAEGARARAPQNLRRQRETLPNVGFWGPWSQFLTFRTAEPQGGDEENVGSV